MSKRNTCSKCGGKMEQGFIPDFFHHSSREVAGWHAGAPKKSFWSGTKAPRTEGIPVGAFRCEGCGFIELFANKEFAAS